MTLLKVGDRVRVLPGQGWDNLVEGTEHDVTYVNDNVETVRVSGTNECNWNMTRFERINDEKINVGDLVRVRTGKGVPSHTKPLLEGDLLTVERIERDVLYFTDRSQGWFTNRFEKVKSAVAVEVDPCYVTALEAFKQKAIAAYPVLDDDPDMAEAIKIYDKYMADNNNTPTELYFKEAIKLGRKLEKEGK